MDLDRLKQVAELMREHGLQRIVVSSGDEHIELEAGAPSIGADLDRVFGEVEVEARKPEPLDPTLCRKCKARPKATNGMFAGTGMCQPCSVNSAVGSS